MGESVDPDRFRAVIQERRASCIELLEKTCAVPSGSEMTDGVTEVGRLFAERLTALGLTVRRHPGAPFADHIVASNDLPGPQLVLGGHIDTTYTDYAPLPEYSVDGPHAIGPGTSDMRGGVLVFLTALECLAREGLLARLPITVVLNTDEERGAPTSRAIFRELAERASVALFAECGGPNGEVVVSRRAKLSYQLDVRGVGRHAGDRGIEKISALVALSHKVIAIEELNERFDGAAFNVGRAWGGIASNTVPEEAVALIDIRYPLPDQEGPIRSAMEAICAAADVAGTRATLAETSFRPAWQQSNATRALFEHARTVADSLGMPVTAEHRGGTADSNWFGAVGVPCLDGLGPIGFADHTPEERILLDSLFERALLVATLLASLEDHRIDS